MDNLVYAQKGTAKTRFTALIWKNMGKNKNGWVPISKEHYDSKTVTAAPGAAGNAGGEVVNEQEYRKLFDQGKGFEADGKVQEAFAKFQAAYAIKPNNSLKGRINKIDKAIQEGKARAALIIAGDASIAEGDYETGLDAYEQANALAVTEDLTAKIEVAKNSQADSLVE